MKTELDNCLKALERIQILVDIPVLTPKDISLDKLAKILKTREDILSEVYKIATKTIQENHQEGPSE